MRTFRVWIESRISGYFDIDARSEGEAMDKAEGLPAEDAEWSLPEGNDWEWDDNKGVEEV
jgi:hypothetical protein